jgi:hypothetical protein
MCLPQDDLQEESSWSSSPVVLLQDIQVLLESDHDYQDDVPEDVPPSTWCEVSCWTLYLTQLTGRGLTSGAGGPLFLPPLHRVHDEVFHVWGEDISNMPTIPTQDLLPTIKHCQPFQVLHQTFTDSHRAEHLRLRNPHRIVVTTVDSVLHNEMTDLESQQENNPPQGTLVQAYHQCPDS